MKIQQLLKREPFGDIIEKTLGRFLAQFFGQSHSVVWQSLNPFQVVRSRAEGGSWYCNPYLNAIYSSDAIPVVLKTIYKDYAYTPFAYRRYAQRLYVTAATQPLTSRLFAKYGLHIQPMFPGSERMLILGGNNRIRMIDLEQKRTWDILKADFDLNSMVSELKVRQTPGLWPFPTVRSTAEDNTWFESDYVDAVGLNRLPIGPLRESCSEQALTVLVRWLAQSRIVCNVLDYVERLVVDIERLAQTSRLLEDADRALIAQWTSIALYIVRQLVEHGNSQIECAHGHGDFQDGNILVDLSHKVWLVDWEYARLRQLLYDYLVFALRSRFPKGLAARLRLVLNSPGSGLLCLAPIRSQLERIHADTGYRSMVLSVFLLEELLWNLEENSNPLFRCQSGAWLLLRAELGPALQSIVMGIGQS